MPNVPPGTPRLRSYIGECSIAIVPIEGVAERLSSDGKIHEGPLLTR